MNENTKKWVAALRSGEYKQTQGRLQENDCYCCLGVACDLFIKEHPDKLVRQEVEGRIHFSHEDQTVFNILPKVVQEWLGLTSDSGKYYDDVNGNTHLWADNDVRRKTFKQIASIIESEPMGLFVKNKEV